MTNVEAIEKYIMPKTSCLKCNKAYCCKWTDNIDLSEKEWKRLIPYIDNSVIAKMRIAILNKKKHNKYDCAFLDDNNKCIAYKDRPLVCKLHFVLSPKKYCNSLQYPDRDIQILNKADIYLALPYHEDFSEDNGTMIEKYENYLK